MMRICLECWRPSSRIKLQFTERKPVFSKFIIKPILENKIMFFFYYYFTYSGLIWLRAFFKNSETQL